MSSLAGKVAFVTGAGSGIDAAAARALAAEGVKLGLASLEGDDLGLDAVAEVCDVRDFKQVEALVRRTVERFGRLDIVFANAGIGIINRPFLEHSVEEQRHADMIAERIRQLGGAPDFNPQGLLTRSHAQYSEGQSLVDMIKEDLIAERIAIESYMEIIRFFGNDDPTSRRMMEEILAKEEEHADDLATLLETLDPREPTEPITTKH